MARPRFLFVVGAAEVGRKWVAGVATVPTEPGDQTGWVGWRLLGGNNRELGRSAVVYPDLAACRAAVERLQAQEEAAEVAVAAEPASGQWWWRLDLAGRAVAVSARSYHRQRECLYNLRQFRAAIRVAGSGPNIVVLSREGHHVEQAPDTPKDTDPPGDAGHPEELTAPGAVPGR